MGDVKKEKRYSNITTNNILSFGFRNPANKLEELGVWHTPFVVAHPFRTLVIFAMMRDVDDNWGASGNGRTLHDGLEGGLNRVAIRSQDMLNVILWDGQMLGEIFKHETLIGLAGIWDVNDHHMHIHGHILQIPSYVVCNRRLPGRDIYRWWRIICGWVECPQGEAYYRESQLENQPNQGTYGVSAGLNNLEASDVSSYAGTHPKDKGNLESNCTDDDRLKGFAVNSFGIIARIVFKWTDPREAIVEFVVRIQGRGCIPAWSL
ncbi:hypothetical protein B0H14DRAFT_2563857 [Mycena olivaceomarginata]|nr:hypothetical protein B0H14DRAFT_2563857 [Mycena olivaceomarginata]